MELLHWKDSCSPRRTEFYWQVDEKEIVRDMLAEFRKFFSDSLQQQARKMKMTIDQVLTMASIVEGETVLDRERPIIAGLYYNRLHRRIKLEADPTIQYIIPDGPRRLFYNDLKIDSPSQHVQILRPSPGAHQQSREKIHSCRIVSCQT